MISTVSISPRVVWWHFFFNFLLLYLFAGLQLLLAICFNTSCTLFGPSSLAFLCSCLCFSMFLLILGPKITTGRVGTTRYFTLNLIIALYPNPSSLIWQACLRNDCIDLDIIGIVVMFWFELSWPSSKEYILGQAHLTYSLSPFWRYLPVL